MFTIMLNDSYSVVKVPNKRKFISASFITGNGDAWKINSTLLACIINHELHVSNP